jgi:hypothetical protein
LRGKKIRLAQDRDKFWILVSGEMNAGFRQMRGISWLNEELFFSEEGLSYM